MLFLFSDQLQHKRDTDHQGRRVDLNTTKWRHRSMFKLFFMYEDCYNLIDILIKFLAKGPIKNTSFGLDKPLSGQAKCHYQDQWWSSLPTYKCITLPQGVKNYWHVVLNVWMMADAYMHETCCANSYINTDMNIVFWIIVAWYFKCNGSQWIQYP